MNISNYLAQLWGVTIAVVSLALLMRPKLPEKLFAAVKDEAVMVFLGVVTFVIGLAMVLVHNLWVPDWRLLITLLGWLTLIKGLDLLFLPGRMNRRWPQMKTWLWQLIFSSLLLFGLALSYLGFTS